MGGSAWMGLQTCGKCLCGVHPSPALHRRPHLYLTEVALKAVCVLRQAHTLLAVSGVDLAKCLHVCWVHADTLVCPGLHVHLGEVASVVYAGVQALCLRVLGVSLHVGLSGCHGGLGVSALCVSARLCTFVGLTGGWLFCSMLFVSCASVRCET